MAVLWIEGWRNRGGETELALDYAFAGAGSIAVAVLTARRTTCYAATLTSKSAKRTIAVSSGASIITEFAFVWGGTNAGTICHVMEGSTTHCSLGITAPGVLTVYRGDSNGTALDTGSTLVAGTVYHISIVATVGDGTGSEFTVYLDDVEDISVIGGDTRQTGTPTVDGIMLEGAASGNKFADWVIIDPSDANGRVTKIGSSARVDCRLAISQGAKADFLPNTGTNVAAIDDSPHDSDTTYVASNDSGSRDLYVVEQMTHYPQSLYAMQVHAIARKVDAADRSLRPILRASDGTVYGGESLVLTTSYADAVTIYESGGLYDDGGAYTQAGFNARQFGFEVV